MKNPHPIYRKIVVKVGTNVITDKNGDLDLEILQQLTAQIAELQKQGIQIILVSSGAVGAGRSVVKLSGTIAPVAARQVLASTVKSSSSAPTTNSSVSTDWLPHRFL